MPVFLFKSLLSLLIILLTIVAMFTMFEIFGRAEKRYNIDRLKKIHRANGLVYLLIFIFISYYCLGFIAGTKAELSARSAFHAVFALTVLVLVGLKISFVSIYRQFYGKAQTVGLLLATTTFLLFGTSGGYYFLVTKAGTDLSVSRKPEVKKEAGRQPFGGAVRTDAESITKGKELYESKCYFCHDAYSNKTEVGPGHKGILRNPLLPVSKKPATPENVANQLRDPFRDMPSFSYLSDGDVQNILAFLNTL